MAKGGGVVNAPAALMQRLATGPPPRQSVPMRRKARQATKPENRNRFWGRPCP